MAKVYALGAILFLLVTAPGCESEEMAQATLDISDVQESDISSATPLGAETISSQHRDNERTPEDIEDPTEAVFKLDRVLHVDVEIDPDDWDELRKASRTFEDILFAEPCPSPPEQIFEYFPAKVTVDGSTFSNVGVRKKGFFGSLSDTKPSLKIKFNEYEEDLEFEGMERLTLNNSQQDPSYLNTCLSYRRFAAANYPAPRCNFAHVTVNGEELGVYVHVESMKKDFLRRNFKNPDGNLYEGTLSDFSEEWRGSLQKKTNKEEADWSDIDAAIAAVKLIDIYGTNAIKSVFDLDAFLTFWALEVLVAHWDGYAGNRNNFYIYRDPETEQFIFLPWGADATFRSWEKIQEESAAPPSVVANGILAHKLYQDPETRDQYIARLTELLDTIWNEEEILDEIDTMESIVTPYLAQFLQPALTTKINDIRDFVESQRNAIMYSISPEPPSWDAPLGGPPCFEDEGEITATVETQWGTLGAGDPFSNGVVESIDFILDGEQREYEDIGVTAGEGINEEGQEEGNLSIYLQHADGLIEALIFAMPPNMMKTGAQIPLQQGFAQGFRILLQPPYTDFEIGSFIGFGGIKFEEVDKTAGGTVRAKVQGRLLSFEY